MSENFLLPASTSILDDYFFVQAANFWPGNISHLPAATTMVRFMPGKSKKTRSEH